MPTTEGYGKSLVFLGQGFTFAAVVGVAAFAGHKADEWLGTKPWLLLTATLIGVALATIDLIRTVEAWEKRNRDKEE